MAKFKFESLKFEQIMKDYAEIREVTIPDAVMLNARLLCVELARRTQPFGADDKAKLTGEKAITRSGRRAVIKCRSFKASRWHIRNHWRSNEYKGWLRLV